MTDTSYSDLISERKYFENHSKQTTSNKLTLYWQLSFATGYTEWLFILSTLETIQGEGRNTGGDREVGISSAVRKQRGERTKNNVEQEWGYISKSNPQ